MDEFSEKQKKIKEDNQTKLRRIVSSFVEEQIKRPKPDTEDLAPGEMEQMCEEFIEELMYGGSAEAREEDNINNDFL